MPNVRVNGTQTGVATGDMTKAVYDTNNDGVVDSAATFAAGSATNLTSGTLPAARLPALSGDVTSSAGSASVTVAKVNGVAVTGTPSSGQVITATGASAATWQTPSGGSGGALTPALSGSQIALDGSRLGVTWSANQSNHRVVANSGKSSGRWFFEVTAYSSATAGTLTLGVTKTTGSLTSYLGSTANDYVYYGYNGNKGNNNSFSAYGAAYGDNATDVIGVALDLDGGTLVFYKNGTTQGTAYSSLSGTFYPAVGADGSTDTTTFRAWLNFGQFTAAYSLPAGFSWWS